MKTRLVGLALGVACILLPPLSALGAPHPGGNFRLEVPPAPILPGDVLSIHGTARFDREPGLNVLIGGVSAELVGVRSNRVQAVVPFGLAEGAQRVDLRSVHGVRFSATVELAPIQARAVTASEFKWGLTFADPVRFSVGSAVSGWLLTRALSAVPGTLAPVSVTGKITGRIDNVLSLGLVSDTEGVVARLTLASLDLATGQFFGRTDSLTENLRIEGIASITVPPPVVKPRPRPVITSVTPNPVRPGGAITILGQGFGAAQGRSTLALAGTPVTDFPRVTAWSDTRIVAIVGQFMGGDATVEIVVGGLPPIPPVVIDIDPPCPPALPEFVRAFGGAAEDLARAVQQTRDCGYVLAGRTASIGAGGLDAYLIKTNRNGELEFQRTYGGSGTDEAFGVQQTFDGGYIIAGFTRAAAATITSVLLVKTDALGIVTWSRRFGATGTSIGRAVQQTQDGGYIVAGSTAAPGGRADVLLLRVDADGELLWQRTFGGIDADEARAVRQTAEGGYVVAGFTRSFGAGLEDVYLVKTNTDGQEEWSRTFGGIGLDEAHAVQQITGGGYVLGGRTNSRELGAATLQALAIRTDALGRRFTARVFGGTGTDEAFGLAKTADGGYVLAGRTNSAEFGVTGLDSLLIKTDCRLDQQNRRNAFGVGNLDDTVVAVQETADGSYILAGSIARRVAGATNDVLLIKARPFARMVPTIETFTANGAEFREVSVGDVELFWHVTNATSIRVQRISGPGPDVDETLPGGADVQDQRTVTFTLDVCSGPDGCSDTVYRVTATRGCDVAEANVTVRQEVSERVRRLVEIETTLVQRLDFTTFPPPLVDEGLLVPTHPNVLGLDFFNTCFEGQGKPFLRLPQGLALEIDDREPGLVLYGSFAGQANRLVGWGYAAPFLPFTRPPAGLPVDDDEWFIHWGGWHTGEGAMTRWNILELPPLPPLDIPGTPLNEGLVFLAYCATLPNGCGPPPYVPHPSLWDVHMFRDPANGPPRVGILTPSTNVGLPDPCGGAGLSGLDGDPFADRNGACLFCYPGETTTPP